MLKDRRCWKCNWLNKEISEEFVCINCGEENLKEIEEFEEHIKKTSKKLKGGK